MHIGFDAKRAFFNRSGLGNYSRDTIRLLSHNFPFNDYVLYTPNVAKSKPFYSSENIVIKGPEKFLHQKFPSLWRSKYIVNQLVNDKLDLFHGLSNELPHDISKTKIPTIVTIHDLIFYRFPQYYKFVDRQIYKSKFAAAAHDANRIIAISEQTKRDIIQYLKVKDDKIDVVYQGCNAAFYNNTSESEKEIITKKYNLPSKYLLYVGTIEERKNLLSIIKAIEIGKIDIPLVAIGKQTPYFETIKKYIKEKQIQNIFFYQNIESTDLPTIYQMAKVFIYPSIFEGFGIPILEALNSKVPVITSEGSCFAEAGGKSSVYINPGKPEEIADAIKTILSDSSLRDNMIINGYLYAQQFRQDKIASNLMEVYKKIM